MMKRVLLASLLAATAGALSVTLSAQLNFPEILYDAVDPITANLPQDIYLGEAAGVATNSKGEIFVYTRTGTPMVTSATARNVSHGGARLFQFDRLLARRDSRVVAAEWVHDHVPAGSTILQNGGRYGRVQFDPVYGYEDWTTEQAVAALRSRDGDPVQGQTDWIILYESPLGRHVDPAIAAAVRVGLE